MRNWFLVTFLLVPTLQAFSSAGDSREELRVVSRVDLNRYMGKWYEIARLPNPFQKKCAAAVMATYSLLADGKVSVLNECLQSSGKSKSAKGKAKVADSATNAKLRVTFFWPFYGDYWILELGADYEYAVIGEPKRRYCWILSRTPEMEEPLYQELIGRIAKQGYDTSGFIRTPSELGR